MAALWCEVLGLEEVSIRAGFTSLGGTSVQLVQLLTRLRSCFHGDLSIVDLFRYPTVERQAAYLAGAGVGTNLAAAHQRARRQQEALERRATGGGR